MTGSSRSNTLDPERLRRHRRTARLTQAELAERAGAAQTTIGGLECGDHGASDDLLERIAEVLGVTVADLAPEQQ